MLELSEYMLFLCAFYLLKLLPTHHFETQIWKKCGFDRFVYLMALSLFYVLQFFILMQNVVMGLWAKRPLFLHLALPCSPQTFTAYHLFIPCFR